MVLVHKKVRKAVIKDDDWDFAAINAEAMKNAQHPGKDTWVSPEFSSDQKKACLERWYVRGKFNDNIKDLTLLEPSGLTDKEKRDWYWGLRQEALYKVFSIINQSYSKSDMKESMESEGLQNALILFDPPEGLDISAFPSGIWDLRESFNSVVKYISD